MAGVNLYNAGNVSNLFSSLGTSSNNNSSSNNPLGINLMDYSSIQNGSYGKLMKAYYNMDEIGNDTKVNSKNDTNDTDQTLKEIKEATGDLKESSKALYSNKSLFEKNKDGEYDMEAIYDKVNTFIEDYNATIKSVGSAETESLAKAGANIVNATDAYKDMLKEIGISVNGSDYTLSIDKEKFMESKISTLKSMFSGVGSMAYQIGAKASRIEGIVSEKLPSRMTLGASSSSSSATSVSKDSASTIAKVKEDAENLTETSTKLYKNRSLFRENADGTYKTEEILEEVSSFIKDYNNLVISGENSKSSNIQNAITTMTNVTKEQEEKLSEIGITIDKEDKTLVLNQDTFKKADMSKVEDLFSGSGSLAYQVSVKSAMVENQAEKESARANTYSQNATYANNYNTGSIFNGMI